ncbi:MAG: regulator [Clostridia bacterium BRH_c25]|nr:MAG: regulator [Clostridia bacterium BRH_c25]
MNKSILIIDDEIGICSSLLIALEDKYKVKACTSPSEGLKAIEEEYFNICLLDLRIGEYGGLDVLSEIKKIDKSIIVIIMTAYGSIDTTVEAMKYGAYTYLIKPLNINELYILIEQALEFQRLNEKVEYLSKELENKYVYNGIIGRSFSMKNVFNMIEKLKDVDTNVVIIGESGTGKELVARAIHFSGRRKNERFVEVNCAAIPEGLLEEELFGHRKGSFTGAVDDRQGKFEYANNGTIFLDEIGDMPIALQAKLLRVLQQKEYSPIGSNEKRKINIRVISATNKDLKSLVESGDFRQDLYFRLNVIEINLPALKDKKQDLPLLFEHFIKKFNEELGKNIRGLSKEAEKKMIDYNYPGNIRELSNIFEYSMVLTNKEVITVDDLPDEVKSYKSVYKYGNVIISEDLIGLSLKEIEKRVIKASLINNNGSRKLTAQMLGISEKGLRNKINEYKL